MSNEGFCHKGRFNLEKFNSKLKGLRFESTLDVDTDKNVKFENSIFYTYNNTLFSSFTLNKEREFTLQASLQPLNSKLWIGSEIEGSFKKLNRISVGTIGETKDDTEIGLKLDHEMEKHLNRWTLYFQKPLEENVKLASVLYLDHTGTVDF